MESCKSTLYKFIKHFKVYGTEVWVFMCSYSTEVYRGERLVILKHVQQLTHDNKYQTVFLFCFSFYPASQGDAGKRQAFPSNLTKPTCWIFMKPDKIGLIDFNHATGGLYGIHSLVQHVFSPIQCEFGNCFLFQTEASFYSHFELAHPNMQEICVVGLGPCWTKHLLDQWRVGLETCA